MLVSDRKAKAHEILARRAEAVTRAERRLLHARARYVETVMGDDRLFEEARRQVRARRNGRG